MPDQSIIIEFGRTKPKNSSGVYVCGIKNSMFVSNPQNWSLLLTLNTCNVANKALEYSSWF